MTSEEDATQIEVFIDGAGIERTFHRTSLQGAIEKRGGDVSDIWSKNITSMESRIKE